MRDDIHTTASAKSKPSCFATFAAPLSVNEAMMRKDIILMKRGRTRYISGTCWKHRIHVKIDIPKIILWDLPLYQSVSNTLQTQARNCLH